MKRIGKISLKGQATVLSEEEMAKVLGKGQYRCCCGMGSSGPCFNIYASSSNDAVLAISYVCEKYGGMGGCFLP